MTFFRATCYVYIFPLAGTSSVELLSSLALGFQDIADVTSKTAIVPLTPKSGHLKGNNNGNTVSLEKSGAAEKSNSRQVRAALHNPYFIRS